MDSSLSNLFRQALSTASTATNLPTADHETQELLIKARYLLHETASRVSTLALFSSNESVEDISTRNLAFLFPPFVLAEVESRLTADDRQDRIAHVLNHQKYHQAFISSLELYDIVSPADKSLYSKRVSAIIDPARRRELKIVQYKQEKEIRGKIDSLTKHRSLSAAGSSDMTNLDLIAALLPNIHVNAEDEEDDTLRETTLLLLRLLYAQAQAQLESSEQELDLLRNAPPSPPRQPPREVLSDIADDWRLDVPRSDDRRDGKGPLLDPSGKPLRPFTILPAGASADRTRLQSQVFGPDHRLPSMSVDEYLQIERQRGNVITGGGPSSEQRLTTSEQLALDSEMDGAIFAEDREEEKRQKDESWARYTDSHPKGAGNTMNRG